LSRLSWKLMLPVNRLKSSPGERQSSNRIICAHPKRVLRYLHARIPARRPTRGLVCGQHQGTGATPAAE
jgi:hypothetical protein